MFIQIDRNKKMILTKRRTISLKRQKTKSRNSKKTQNRAVILKRHQITITNVEFEALIR